jgi:RNA polymerase sigma-70 factor (ECF subfamily)
VNVRGTETKREWFVAMVERFEKPLVAYAVRMLRSLDEAREVVQETFLQLWRADQAELAGREAPWLFRVCRNRAIDRMRKERRMKPADQERIAARPDAGPGPHEIVEENQRRDRVLEQLETLPDNQREVLVLKFQQGLSYRQISRVTGLSQSNVGYLIHQGIVALRQQLAG